MWKCDRPGMCATGTTFNHQYSPQVLIINVWHCHNAFFSDYWGGEGTWCNAMVSSEWCKSPFHPPGSHQRRSLEKQGYTVLYTYYDMEYVEHIYRQIPDLVVAIFLDDDHLSTKIKEHYKTKNRPDGIPAWKVGYCTSSTLIPQFFRFSYYAADSSTLVGDAWSVTCEPEWHQPGHDYRSEPRPYLPDSHQTLPILGTRWSPILRTRRSSRTRNGRTAHTSLENTKRSSTQHTAHASPGRWTFTPVPGHTCARYTPTLSLSGHSRMNAVKGTLQRRARCLSHRVFGTSPD